MSLFSIVRDQYGGMYNYTMGIPARPTPAAPPTTTATATTSTPTATSTPSVVVSIPFPVPVTSAPVPVPVTIPPSTSTPSTPVTSTPSTPVTASTSSSSTSSSQQIVRKGPVKKFACLQCPYHTDRKNDFQNHMNRHLGTGYKCGFTGCTKMYPSNKALQTHIKLIHTKIPRVHCDQEGCTYSTDYYEKWKVHLKESHNIGECDFKCPHQLCKNRKFTNSLVYERHMASYHLPRDEQCMLCRRWFKGEDNLDKHIGDAHQGNPFQCEFCGKVFTTHNNLKVHISRDHRDK